jgi:hypothetical protein
VVAVLLGLAVYFLFFKKSGFASTPQVMKKAVEIYKLPFHKLDIAFKNLPEKMKLPVAEYFWKLHGTSLTDLRNLWQLTKQERDAYIAKLRPSTQKMVNYIVQSQMNKAQPQLESVSDIALRITNLPIDQRDGEIAKLTREQQSLVNEEIRLIPWRKMGYNV